MNKSDILAAANAKVAEYMTEGYMLSWGDSSFGCKFRVDLEKNDCHVRVQVKSFFDSGLGYCIEGLVLTVAEVDCAEGFERKDCAPIFSQSFYRVDGRAYFADNFARYVESKDEALTAAKIRFERNVARYVNTGRNLAPSAALIRNLKKRQGFTKATRNTIQVTRRADGYLVALKNRAGQITRARLFKLGK